MKREYDFSSAVRGAIVPEERGKTRITIRIDNDVLAWFREQVEKAAGGNYQTLINQALRQHIAAGGGSFEATLRRVLREEVGPIRRAPSRRPRSGKRAA